MNIDGPINTQYQRKFRNILLSLNRDLLLIEQNITPHNLISITNLHYYIICLEDRRFYKHHGVDFKSVCRELLKCIMRKKHGGASTIDMQLVRTITGFKDRTIFRKLYESILAFLINYKFTKNQIIECYASNAFFGSRLYGAKSAAIKHFNKDLHHLDNNEMAFIASMLLRPRPLFPSDGWEKSNESRSRYAQAIFRTLKKRSY
ncbi:MULTISPECIES: biosynthetic peptidoglycan transglycosylase [unclassified Providencia]|uniref:biosynthetic peptidoglycan transglycosylase n=2 Tax=Providencia TaxID=586 RepID=UPI0020121C2B|nr:MULTISPECIES: biosynthetic peptidoglycan transglycosylase [unclassified Providencia]